MPDNLYNSNVCNCQHPFLCLVSISPTIKHSLHSFIYTSSTFPDLFTTSITFPNHGVFNSTEIFHPHIVMLTVAVSYRTPLFLKIEY